MELSSDKLFKEFYNKIKDDYPELTKEQVKDIIQSPFKFFKSKAEEGELITMRFKKIGLIKPLGEKIFTRSYSKLDSQLEKERITPAQHKDFKQVYEKYFKTIK